MERKWSFSVVKPMALSLTHSEAKRLSRIMNQQKLQAVVLVFIPIFWLAFSISNFIRASSIAESHSLSFMLVFKNIFACKMNASYPGWYLDFYFYFNQLTLSLVFAIVMPVINYYQRIDYIIIRKITLSLESTRIRGLSESPPETGCATRAQGSASTPGNEKPASAHEE